MDTPTIYGRETTWRALRLFNAVISTGTETEAQCAYGRANEPHVKTLVDKLEWLADGSKVNWVKVLSAARRAVQKFLTLAPRVD